MMSKAGFKPAPTITRVIDCLLRLSNDLWMANTKNMLPVIDEIRATDGHARRRGNGRRPEAAFRNCAVRAHRICKPRFRQIGPPVSRTFVRIVVYYAMWTTGTGWAVADLSAKGPGDERRRDTPLQVGPGSTLKGGRSSTRGSQARHARRTAT